MSQSISRNHHYIPQFYLAGFTNENNRFLIYLVKEGRYKKNGKSFSPESHFFEKNANTVKNIHNEESDFLEKYYSSNDQKVAKVLAKVRTSHEKNYGITDEEIPLLQYFVAILFWRLPANKEFVIKFANSSSLSQLALILKDKVTHESVDDKELDHHIRSHPDFYKFLRVWLPMATYQTIYECHSPVTIFPFPDALPSICSDNPLILRNPLDFDIYKDDFILPLTGIAILIRTKKIKEMIDPTVKVEIDMLLVMQATEYVCCVDKKYIPMLKAVYFNEYKSIEYLRECIFAKLTD